MASTPRDDYGNRHIVGAPGYLIVLGAVLPTLWAIWLVPLAAPLHDAMNVVPDLQSEHTI